MSKNFKTLKGIAVDTLSLSPLMAGREQLKTDDVVGEEVTIIAFDFATITDENGNEKTFPVLHLKEYPNHYLNGGCLLNKLCMAWTAALGDVETASDALYDEGGVKIRIRNGRTKSGRNLTTVDVL